MKKFVFYMKFYYLRKKKLMKAVTNNPLNSKLNNTSNNINTPVFPHTACIIMASGEGKRFGGNKLMADFKGKPLIAHILDKTEDLFGTRVVVTRHRDVEELCHSRNIEVVYHELPYRNDTIRLGISALPEHINSCMFCPGDQPLLTRETIINMARASQKEPDLIWRLACEGQAGTPVIFPAWCFPKLSSLPEGKGGNVIIKKYPHSVKLCSALNPHELRDIDTREELEALRTLFYK
jgi:molybdenum cofactor cytidylyltransferase